MHEGILLLSKIPKFEHHSIASGGYHSVRSLTVLVNTVLYYLTSSEICPDKRGDLIREVLFINTVLYYLTSSEICPDKRGTIY